MPEDAAYGQGRKERRMSDRGHGLSGRLCRRSGNEYPCGEGSPGSAQVCEGFYKIPASERVFRDRAAVSGEQEKLLVQNETGFKFAPSAPNEEKIAGSQYLCGFPFVVPVKCQQFLLVYSDE